MAGDYLGEPGVNGRVILKWVSKYNVTFELDLCGSETGLWPFRVKIVMSFLLLEMLGTSRLGEQLLVFQKGLSCMDFNLPSAFTCTRKVQPNRIHTFPNTFFVY
jgi:hypothetical protein